MDNDSLNIDTRIPSLSNILDKSINICSRTIINRDGKVQSYCGLKLTNIHTQASGTPPLPNNTNTSDKRKAVPSTSRHPLNISELSRSEHPRTRESTKIPKRAALTSAGVDETIVAGLISMLDNTSAVAQAFRMARDWCHSHESVNFELCLLSDRTSARQYNAPTVLEVAALITNDFGDDLPSRDIVVDNKDGGPKRILELHPSYMALQYPLLFPYGEDGFHEKIPYHSNRGTRKTKRGYEQRLQWTRNNQDTLRVDLYHNLNDALTRGDTNAEGLGKRIVLPKSFTGGPRYKMQNYQDAMALCRVYGNPKLFITFTSNPKWPKITEMLAFITGQKPYDRPEVGTRVFKMNLTHLLDDLTKNEIFGKTCAFVYVIEFQKCGLLHSHILLWLEEEWKCKTPNQVDDIISAKIPSPTTDPKGYKVVTEFMLHGPCGKGVACTVEGKCSKKFPKPSYSETMLDEDGYPVYRRRDSKVQAVKGKFTYDNKYVVPYNRYLLLKYQAHINVEWCNGSKAIKYLFEYLNKGPDRATFVIQENIQKAVHGEPKKVVAVNEIKNNLNYRYLAPCEAVWRLFSFDIHYSYQSVMKLNFHLEDQHAITLCDSQNLPALLIREDIKITMFTEWFELNKHETEARELTYAEIPKGPRGFKELMTVNKKLYLTFKVACFAYGLLNDDKEWAHAILEAAFWALGPQLRDLFITMLLFCDVSRPLKLWEQTWELLSEDILRRKRPANMIARRVTNDLISFSGETAPPKYMKFFLVQKIAESRRFVNRIRDEADTVRECIAQLTAVIAELLAMEDQDEVHDSLLAANDAKRGEEGKLVALNDVIAEALDEIETQEIHVEILDGAGDGV
ncbi:helicase [Tanacetum coccineum]